MFSVARCVVAVVMVLAMAGPGIAADRSMGRVVDDAKISMSVKAKLVADRLSNLTRVDVKVMNGVVTLDGEADTDEQKARAEDFARRADGVQQVVNNIRVAPQPAAQPATR